MAKKSKVEANERRKRTAAKYAARRALLKEHRTARSDSERAEAVRALSKCLGMPADPYPKS